MDEISSKKVDFSFKLNIKNRYKILILFNFPLFFNLLLIISQPFVGRFGCKIAFWTGCRLVVDYMTEI